MPLAATLGTTGPSPGSGPGAGRSFTAIRPAAVPGLRLGFGLQVAQNHALDGGGGLGDLRRDFTGLMGDAGELIEVHADAPNLVERAMIQSAIGLDGDLPLEHLLSDIFGR